jgi:hypothetical protein
MYDHTCQSIVPPGGQDNQERTIYVDYVIAQLERMEVMQLRAAVGLSRIECKKHDGGRRIINLMRYSTVSSKYLFRCHGSKV